MYPNRHIVYVLFIFCISSACQDSPENQYLKLQKKELKSGQRFDSLFYDIHLGMSEPEFRDYCYNMNLAKKFRQGGLRNSFWVSAKLSGELKYPAELNFYPSFKDNKISEMSAAIYYDSNLNPEIHIHPEDLLPDVLSLLDRWFGGKHFKIKSPYFYRGDIYVKIKGNRRITVYEDPSGQMINLWIVDMYVKEAPNKY